MLRHTKRTRCVLLLFVLSLLSPLLCTCVASLSPMSLWGVLLKPFTCGLRAETEEGEVLVLSFVRTATKDTLLVTGDYGVSVFSVRDGQWSLCVGESEETDAQYIPIPTPTETLLFRVYACISALPDSSARTKRTGDDILLSFQDKSSTVVAVFSRDGIPKTVSDGSMTVRIHSFVSE